MRTAHFRIREILVVPPKPTDSIHRYEVDKRFLWFWWIPEKGGYWTPFGQGNEYVLRFNTEAEALEYINNQPYQTKVLWTKR